MSEIKEPKTVGHAIDGIEEYDNPLPRWWLFMFYFTIVFALVYQVLYPSWFGKGLLNWSQISAYEEEVKQAKVLYPSKEITIADLIGNPDHIEKGRLVFQQNCAACHGAEAKGLIGPDLTDNIWVHGGTPEEIVKTVSTGVLEKGMPNWDKPLGNEKVGQVSAFVYSLSNK